MKTAKRILILAPHTDDGEFGCGGSIAKFLEDGADVYYAAFSTAKESVPPGMPENILEIEVKEATKRLGIKPENLLIYGFTVRKLNYVRQDLLEEMVRLKQDLDPDLVFMPSPHDLHQDHNTVAMEGQRAFKQTTILAYEIPWNHINFETRSFIRLEKRHIDKKIYALDAYNSQKMRKYASKEFIMSLATTRGVQIGCDYAECFEVIRYII
ncbi:MAG: N-acetylglucosamine malate deacetylase 1 [Candidatus Marinimicrobia bacterium]|jgi:LmbE family N-acetylglucosaminyl deacetylase|uniref:PIG-L deacetylase family protein n=1 Tax=Fidelibacter multiformis TaxID=3377529 RepID=UPI0029E6F38C|nr:N-acetylglucosamine malate deacetylase 1 [Candidatus Neomarinimicrobiota bacterium]